MNLPPIVVVVEIGATLRTFERAMSKRDVADLIERFLCGQPGYPQEWNDFVDTPQKDKGIDVYREICSD